MPVDQTTTDWVVLQRADLYLVLEPAKLDKADYNVSADTTGANAAFDPTTPATLRSTQILATYVEKFREAVRMAGRFPLSVTPAAVPEDAMLHILRLTVFELLAGKLDLAAVLLTKEMPTWQRFYEEGMAYLKSVREGGSVPVPIDPTGRDYLTAVSDTNLAISLVSWSDLNATDDQYAAGYKTTSTGATISLPLDDMTTY